MNNVMVQTSHTHSVILWRKWSGANQGVEQSGMEVVAFPLTCSSFLNNALEKRNMHH